MNEGCTEQELLSLERAPVAESDLEAIVDTFGPAEVEWISARSDESRSPVTATVTAAGDYVVVERSSAAGDCRPGPELRLPVEIALAIDDGLTATFATVLDASGAGPDEIYVPETVSDDAALSAEWQALADQTVSEFEPQSSGTTVNVALSGTLEELQLSISGEPQGIDGGVIALWFGVLLDTP